MWRLQTTLLWSADSPAVVKLCLLILGELETQPKLADYCVGSTEGCVQKHEHITNNY